MKREAILIPVPKQGISKDILSYRSHLERTKIAIHWFGKYLYVEYLIIHLLDVIVLIFRDLVFSAA